MQQLKCLKLYSSDDIQTIVDSGWDRAVDIFPNLESLAIKDCMELKEICNGFLTGRSFSRLQDIKVVKCGKMKTLFSVSSNENATSMLQFVELQRLSLYYLPELISFWHEDKRNGEMVTRENIVDTHIALFDNKVMLPYLEEIIIEEVYELNGIWHREQQLCPNSFDKLRMLEIKCCPKLMIIFPSHIGNSLNSLETLLIKDCESLELVFDLQGVYMRETHSGISDLSAGVLCFPNLQKVHVEECKRLNYLFPASMAKTLEKLQSLRIRKCSMIQEIIIKEENNNPSSSEEENGDRDYNITFSKLKFLELEQLPRLRSFSSKNFIFKFPSLDEFIVIKCLELRTFSKEMPSTPRLNSVKIEGSEYESFLDDGVYELWSDYELYESCWEGNLNATIQKIYTDKLGFRRIILSDLTQFPRLKKLWHGQVSIEFKNLTSLKVDRCEFDSNVVIPFNVLNSLTNLEEIHVWGCESVEAVFDLEGINNRETNITLETHLKSLRLDALPNLKHVWNGDGKEIVTFQNLVSVIASECEQLRSVFPANIAKGLTHFHWLSIEDCGVEEIVAKKEGQAMFLSFMFPELIYLNIRRVPNLKCFYPGDSTVKCPKLLFLLLDIESEENEFVTQLLKVLPPTELSMQLQKLCPKSFDELQTLNIYACSELVTIFPSHIGLPRLKTLLIENCESLEHVFDVQGVYAGETHNEIICLATGMLCFPNLQQVQVKRRKRLKYLFPSSVAKTLDKLKSLEIKDCSTIEEIIKDENNNPSSSEKENGDRNYNITLSKLKFLEFKQLPRLRSFSSKNVIFKFPSLEEFIITECLELRTFSEEIPSTPYLKSVNIEGREYESCWEGNLNATIQKIYNDKVGFHSIRLSNLTEFPQLKELWQGLVSTEFKYLTSLEVNGCEFDSNVIIPFNVLKSLTNLEDIQVQKCESVEAVFDLEGINNQATNVTLKTQLKKLTLECLPNLKHVWNGNGKEFVTFQNLQTVTASECEQLRSVFPANIAKGLTHLEKLSIEDCGVEEIVAKEEGPAMSLSFIFPKLTSLRIWNAPNLKWFYPGDCTMEFPELRKLFLYIQSEAGEFVAQLLKVLSNLEIVVLNNIVSITGIWPQLPLEEFQRLNVLLLYDLNAEQACIQYWNLHRIQNLLELLLVNSSFKEVFTHVEGGDNFVNLKYLTLSCLPVLEHIYKEGLNLHKYVMHLEKLLVEECCVLTELVPSSASFNHLQRLDVCKCDGLLHLVTSSTAKSFVQLTTLIVKECNKIKEIVTKEEVEDKDNEIRFCKLEVLEFHQLSSLGSFSSGSSKFKFPSLKNFVMNQSPKLTIFSEKIPSTPRLKSVQIKDKCYWEDNLNATIQKIYSDKMQNVEQSTQDSDL